MQNKFIHHVFFWLKNPGSTVDKQQLIAGLQKLSVAASIQSFHIGTAAATNRDVIDTTYSVSWLLIFADAAAQETYQQDPIHLQFVKECAPLWQKVVVYDTVDA
jgi:Stress responsive A/B Barrel Domain